MTVRELIEELQKVENKELDVVIEGRDTSTTEIELIVGAHRYYGKPEATGYTHRTRECVILID